jgi:hypothetical protein
MREPTSDEDRNRLNALSESLFGGPHERDATPAVRGDRAGRIDIERR